MNRPKNTILFILVTFSVRFGFLIEWFFRFGFGFWVVETVFHRTKLNCISCALVPTNIANRTIDFYIYLFNFMSAVLVLSSIISA